MRIIGIDPGIHLVGYALLERDADRDELLDFGVIKTAPGLEMPERLRIIAADLENLCEKYQPETAAIESLFFAKNTKTALKVAEARGVIVHCLYSNGLKLFEYTPLQVKSAITGYGAADKLQVQRMVQILLNLKKIPYPDDAADAIAVAICCLNSLKFGEAVRTPAVTE